MTASGRALGTIGFHCQVACLWEATARKPGNVHRFKDFADVTYIDFVMSAVVIGEAFGQGHGLPLGALVEHTISATREVVTTNTNLGMVLLLAPLAKAAAAGHLRDDLPGVLNATTVRDAIDVYRAIRLANPGGLGRVDQQDVYVQPTKTLREVMALAAERDLIARQYTNGFQEVLQHGVPALERGLSTIGTLEGAIIGCHMCLLALYPDSLIARKCGKDVAVEASRRAEAVLNAGWPHTQQGINSLAEFDAWLRADGHRRNPATTADLVAASLFVALHEDIITLPLQFPWCHCQAEVTREST
jgi:triphosphoribosyl-dephospho-CoA synthase